MTTSFGYDVPPVSQADVLSRLLPHRNRDGTSA